GRRRVAGEGGAAGAVKVAGGRRCVMDQPVLSFRSSFWALWRWTTSVVGTIVALGVSVAAYLNGVEIHLAVVPASFLFALVNTLALAPFVDLYPVDVGADGLKCYDVFGQYHFAPWPTVKGVRPISVLGLRYLRVWSPDTPRPLWVPLF